jgi:hypothetical protein
MNSTLLIAVISIVISGAAAWFAFWQAALTRRSLGAETLLHLDDTWQSEAMLKIRTAAAGQLLEIHAGKPVREVYESEKSDRDSVLDYPETVAFFCRRKVLDRELVWNMFYWPMANYWIACRNYVQHVRGIEGSRTWENLSCLLPKLRDLNREDPVPNEANIPHFPATEAALYDEKLVPRPT